MTGTKARTVGRKHRDKRARPAVPAGGTVEPQFVRERVDMAPTDEARQHGSYERPKKVARGGVLVVYTNVHENLIGKMLNWRTLTPMQAAAAYVFERDHVAAWGTTSPSRDSTIPPIGGTAHETAEQADRISRARARLHAILNRVGPGHYALLSSVCCYGEGIGANRGTDKGKALELRQMLRDALDVCVAVYGIGEA